MIDNKNIFLKKKILIYGLGKSGISSYKFLKNKAKVYLFDDDSKKKIKHQSKQWLSNIKKISGVDLELSDLKIELADKKIVTKKQIKTNEGLILEFIL